MHVVNHRFLVMAKGNVIFQGEVQGMISYFTGLGHALPEFVSQLFPMITTIFECMDILS